MHGVSEPKWAPAVAGDRVIAPGLEMGAHVRRVDTKPGRYVVGVDQWRYVWLHASRLSGVVAFNVGELPPFAPIQKTGKKDMANKDLDGFRKMAEELYQHEAQFRPALKSASDRLREECLAVLEGAARAAGAPYKGRRYGKLKSKRVPVAEICRSKARSVFSQYLTDRNIRRREYGKTDEVVEDGNSVTAHAHMSMNGGDRFNAEESRVFQRKSRGPGPATSEGSRNMTRDVSKVLEQTVWSGQHWTTTNPCNLIATAEYTLSAPRMPWGEQRALTRQWRMLREPDTYGPVSLLEPNALELMGMRGLVITYHRPGRIVYRITVPADRPRPRNGMGPFAWRRALPGVN